MNEVLSNSLKNDHGTKILSLDGGGLRGILTLGILKRLESQIQGHYGASQRLCDYFDIIGGTSTGSIIASGLAIGKSVDELIALYQTLGAEIFGKGLLGRWTRGWTNMRAFNRENYDSRKLEKYLKSKDAFGDIAMGDQENIYCGLVINTKRADTYSLWSIGNHPDGKYYEANRDLKLWELTKASSSAPYYFKPTALNVKSRTGKKSRSAFIDGGVSLANNPVWQLFLVSTVPSFGFERKIGEAEMSVFSIGTGKGIPGAAPEKLLKKRAISWAPALPDLFMVDALEMNQTIMSAFGKNIADEVYSDSQYGAMDDVEYVKPKLFSFQRYDVAFDDATINKKLKLGLTDQQLQGLSQMDHVENMDSWLKIGKAYAEGVQFKV